MNDSRQAQNHLRQGPELVVGMKASSVPTLHTIHNMTFLSSSQTTTVHSHTHVIINLVTHKEGRINNTICHALKCAY